MIRKSVTLTVPGGSILVKVQVRHNEYWPERMELRDRSQPEFIKGQILKIGSRMDEQEKLLFYRRLPDSLASLFVEAPL